MDKENILLKILRFIFKVLFWYYEKHIFILINIVIYALIILTGLRYDIQTAVIVAIILYVLGIIGRIIKFFKNE